MKIEDTLERPEHSVTAQSISSSASLIDRAYIQLRAAILFGQLPPGRKLRIREMCNTFDVGPTPVREALSRLVSQGLVATESHKGFYIPALSQADFQDIIRQRLLLEPTILRQAVERGDEQWRERVIASHHHMQEIERAWQSARRDFLQEWEDSHRAFHAILIEGANSPWATRFLHMLHDQCTRYHVNCKPTTFPSDSILEEHHSLVTAVRTADGSLAEVTIRAHIERLLELKIPGE